MQPQEQSNHSDGFRNAIGVVMFLARSLSISVEVFLHRADSFGRRYVGLNAVAGLVFIFFCPVFWEGCDASGVPIFLVLYLFMLIAIRGATIARGRKGRPEPHSLYTGFPRIMRLSRRLKEHSVKRGLEPLLVFLAGGLVMPLSEPVGGYLMVASLGLLISTNLSLGFERRRIADMNDAYIENRCTVEQFRAMRRDRSDIS